MTLAEFENLLLVHGGNPDAWPDDTRAAARDLLDKNPEARQLLEQSRALDGVLRSALDVEHQGAALTGRILAGVARRDRDALPVAPGLLAACGSIAAVSILALGFFVGTLDLAWFDGNVSSDLALLFVDEPQNLMDTL